MQIYFYDCPVQVIKTQNKQYIDKQQLIICTLTRIEKESTQIKIAELNL